MMDEPIAEKDGALHKGFALAGTFWRGIVDAITPPKCLTCGADVAEGAGLCPACWGSLKLIAPPVCDALGTPFAFDEGEGGLSPAAIAAPPDWRKGRAAAAFEGVAQELVHQLKYGDRHEAGLAMARMMAAAGAGLLADCEVIVPVPLHRWRLWQRRFNQAAMLALHLSKASGKFCATDVLLRRKRTRSQVGLDAVEREKNVRRAFDVDMEHVHKISGRQVLLVDDVRTTGATAGACARALLSAGARRVDLLTFALVLEPHRPHIDA